MSQTGIVIIAFLTLAIISYLAGSFSFAIIFTWAYKRTDIRKHGSGNAGLTNVIRSAGKLPAVFTLIGDVAKGLFSVLVGYLIISNLSVFGYEGIIDPIYGKYIAGFFAVIGHVFPIYYGFKGGKGVLTLFAVGLACNCPAALCCFAIFLILTLLTRYVSFASICVVTCFPIFTATIFPISHMGDGGLFLIPQHVFEVIAASMFSLVVVLKHSPNIKRLLKGEEKKMFVKKADEE